MQSRRVVLAIGLGLLAAASGCGPSEAPRPKHPPPQVTASGVRLLSVEISEKRLTAKAARGDAGVTLTLTPGAPILWRRVWWFGDDEIDPPRLCTLRLDDRKGELLQLDGATLGITATRTLEQFEEDLKVAEGLAELLGRDVRAWVLYKWEITDLGRTAKELQGVRAPQ